MPGFDRTGPMGMGPRTGGGFGLCGPGPVVGRGAGYRGAFFGAGRGGYPYGGGRGRVWGGGRRGFFNAPYYPGNYTPVFPADLYPASSGDELDYLKKSLTMLEDQIESVKNRIGELETKEKKE